MTRTEATEMVAKGLRITGQTYAHKDAIKAAGCAWDPASKSWYAPTDQVRAEMQALVDGTFYNSPPPADTTGDESAEALAAKYGRTALAGAKKIEWSVYGLAKGDNGKANGSIRQIKIEWSAYGLAKGDNGKANGSIRQIKGVRYVQVARTPLRYLSRDFLEDCDLFNAEPGGSYQWTGVAVEPTAEEQAADAVASEAKAARDAAPKMWDAVVKRIDQVVTERPAWATKETLVAQWGKPVVIHTGSYPCIYLSDSEVYYHEPGYFACDWDYAPVHRVAPLTDELREAIMAAIAACRQYGLLREAV